MSPRDWPELLAGARRDVERGRAELLEAERTRDGLIVAARKAGVPNIGELAGVSPGRVTQIAGKAPARKAAPRQKRVAKGAQLVEVRRMPAGLTLETAGASTRSAHPYAPRRWRFVDVAGLELVDVIRKHDDVDRVLLVGPRPGDGTPDGVRRWFLGELPDGWVDAGSYVADVDAPVGRYSDPDGRPAGEVRSLEVMRAAAWFGEGAYSPIAAAAAFELVEAGVAHYFGDGARCLSTPATTARALWRRTIPAGRSYPVQSDEVRELIHATAGQARRELLPAPANGWLPGFAYLDGRLMYGALTWGMPVGAPVRYARLDTRDPDAEKVLRGRSRWLVRATVPAGWDHVGLLMAPAGPAPSDGWRYPAEPGERFEAWCDGSEVWHALRAGWRVDVVEGLSWSEGKPLEAWVNRLRQLYGALERGNGARVADEPADVRKLAAGAVRRILLFGIGGFAARGGRYVNRRESARTANLPVDALDVAIDGETVTWRERVDAGDTSCAHPEWSATVWARARVRLLTAPTGDATVAAGALTLPRRDIVAFSTDALYLTRDPGWPDDGQPGRFRRKGQVLGEVSAPATWDALYRLRDAAAGGE